MPPLSAFKPGVHIIMDTKMERKYAFTLTEPVGKNYSKNFKPYYTPIQMMKLGVFEGKYLNDLRGTLPDELYRDAKTSDKPDTTLNLFKIKSRLSLQEWKKRHWIPICKGDPDKRGWFIWYVLYWLGRRIPDVDEVQIARHNAFARHAGQIMASLRRMPAAKRPQTRAQLLKHRPRQRQALLQWAHNAFIKL